MLKNNNLKAEYLTSPQLSPLRPASIFTMYTDMWVSTSSATQIQKYELALRNILFTTPADKRFANTQCWAVKRVAQRKWLTGFNITNEKRNAESLGYAESAAECGWIFNLKCCRCRRQQEVGPKMSCSSYVRSLCRRKLTRVTKNLIGISGSYRKRRRSSCCGDDACEIARRFEREADKWVA